MNSIESVLKVGKVTSIKGRYVEVIVDKSKNTSHLLFNGEIIKNVSVGSYIKITKGFEDLVGKIDGEYINEEKNFDKREYVHDRDKIKRILNISLLGYFEGTKFKQGIKELPLIENECFLLTQDEFDRVHNFIKDIGGTPDIPLEIGNLASEKGKKIRVGINSLFASHIGIFGNTGSGKSYTLASLYHKLFKMYQDKAGFKENAKFLIIDFNGEYSEANSITSNKKVYKLSTRTDKGDKFPINKKEINDLDFWAIFLSATEKTQKPFLERALKNNFYLEKFNKADDFKMCLSNIIKSLIIKKVDKGDILHFLREIDNSVASKNNIIDLIKDYQGHLMWHSTQGKYYYEENCTKTFDDSTGNIFEENFIKEKVKNLNIQVDKFSDLEKIRLRIIFEYYHELAAFNLNSEHISPLIKRLKKIENLDKILTISDQIDSNNLSVISLLDVNTEMKKILPLLICKQIYDLKKLNKKPNQYLNLIIDEAHNILSFNSERESETWKDYRLETFEEIIKEGRKFGVFLTIASQRPSDISATIISQLHNYFLHRLINNRDIEAVEKTISYLDKVSFDALPILPTGTCILAGLSAQVPVVLEIEKIDDKYEPHNKTIKPTDYWN